MATKIWVLQYKKVHRLKKCLKFGIDMGKQYVLRCEAVTVVTVNVPVLGCDIVWASRGVMMAAAGSSQTTVQFYSSVLSHMPEDISLQITQCLY